MSDWTVFPDKPIAADGTVARVFRGLTITTFLDACRYVHQLPYGYNSDRDDPMTLFRENRGSCTTKHAVIALLAAELELAIAKNIGIYAMTEEIVAGTQTILNKYDLPYVPMVHCFLAYKECKVDLTAGNRNGKKRPIDTFLYTAPVAAAISGKDEYLLYRRALTDVVLPRGELQGVVMKRLLKAREEGLALLKANIH
jgi:hypothetical protein